MLICLSVREADKLLSAKKPAVHHKKGFKRVIHVYWDMA